MGQPDGVQRRFRRKGGMAQHVLGEGEVFPRGQRGLQAVAMAHEMTQLDQLRLVGALDRNAAAIGPQPPAQHGDEARLAGAVAAGQRQGLAIGERQVHALENQPPAPATAQILDAKPQIGKGNLRQGGDAADAFDHISFM